MAKTFSLSRGKTLPNTSGKSDFHDLIDLSNVTISGLTQDELDSGYGFVIRASSAPTDTDAVWFDTANSVFKVYNGSSWVELPTISSPITGQSIFYNGTHWVSTVSSDPVYLFTVSGITLPPLAGDTYTNNAVTYTVVIPDISGANAAIAGTLVCTGASDPTATGTLARATGAGDSSISYSAFSGGTTVAKAKAAPTFLGNNFSDIPTTAIPLLGTSKAQFGNVSAASSFTISSLVAGARYKLILNMTQNTSNGFFTLRANADTGGNYNWCGSTYGNAFGGGMGAKGATAIGLMTQGDVAKATYPFWGNIIIQPLNSSNHSILVNGHFATYLNAQNDYANQQVSGQYSGAADVTSITILTSAGTMTGTWELYRLN